MGQASKHMWEQYKQAAQTAGAHKMAQASKSEQHAAWWEQPKTAGQTKEAHKMGRARKQPL
jgi:hypothetical protein